MFTCLIAHKFSYQSENRRPLVPTRRHLKQNPPKYGTVTTCDFVITNTIENMLSKPDIKENIPKSNNNNNINNIGKHKQFGKIPKYLKSVKKRVQEEKDYIQNHLEKEKTQQEAEKNEVTLLDDKERVTLLNQMKDKWEKINFNYQQMTHHMEIDLESKLKKKENYEKEMQQLETDINKLSQTYVFVKK